MDRFGIPNPRKSGSVIGADRQWFGPSCVLLKRVPQGRTESGGIVLAANVGPRVPRGGVTLKRRCTHRPSVIYLIVNKLLSLSLSLSLSRSLSLSLSLSLSSIPFRCLHFLSLLTPRHTDNDTDTQAHTQIDTDTDTQTQTDRCSHILSLSHTHTHTLSLSLSHCILWEHHQWSGTRRTKIFYQR